MTLWIDAQLPPAIAPWIAARFGVQAVAVRDLGLRQATDTVIYRAARDADAVVLTKDADFPHLLSRNGPPPKVLWLTCGNTSKARLEEILARALPQALALLESGESLVQISGPTSEWS